MYGTSRRDWHIFIYSTNGPCYALCVVPKMQGAKQHGSPFPLGRPRLGVPWRGGWWDALSDSHRVALQGAAEKCCRQLEAVVFWAGLQASKAQPFLLKGSICSSLALWQRPPTKANKGSGLACTRSPKDLCSFLEQPRLAQRREAGRST